MKSEACCPSPAKLLAALAATIAGFGLLMLPAARALRGQGRTTPDGIITLDDAVTACRRTGLAGWELVAYAQQMVYRKFVYYSCRNLWDTPGRAFERGMGYCTQYNLSLKQLLDRLGFETQAVFSLKVRIADQPEWRMGHTWLRVCLDGEMRDVCAGRPTNLPGHLNFTPVAPVWRGNDVIFLLSHLGMILFCGFLEWRALLSRQPVPDWMFRKR